MRVLDTSAFIREYDTDEPTASIPLVQQELEGEHALRFDAHEGAGMRVHLPDDDAVAAVERAAARTGDAAELSETDARLLAAALDLDATLVTDDYAMQNVADDLGVAVDPVDRDGITERREWNFQCAGCGREFDDHRDRCPICGSDLTRKNPT